jgi:hypothetical protein
MHLSCRRNAKKKIEIIFKGEIATADDLKDMQHMCLYNQFTQQCACACTGK